MFKICVIGCGRMATSGHGPSFKKYANEYKDTLLAGCCDLKEEAAKSFASLFGFEKAYTDYKAMLDEIKPDVVSLISPVDLTSELAVSILKLGYNLILEKPPGRNREEINAIAEAAKEAGVSVRTSFNRRYTPLVEKLMELMSGEKIMNATYQMYRFNRNESDFSTTSIHAIDVVSFICKSKYKSVSISFQELPSAGEGVANYYLHGELENGTFVQISLVPMGGTVAERISINTDKATYFVELPFWKNCDSPGSLTRVEGNSVTHKISGEELVDSTEMFEESGFYEENRSFFEHLRTKKRYNKRCLDRYSVGRNCRLYKKKDNRIQSRLKADHALLKTIDPRRNICLIT